MYRIIALLLMVWPLALAAQPNGLGEGSGLSEEGLVINHTMTRIGNDFYQAFFARWQEQDTRSRYTVTIHERPSARWGSTVWVEYQNKRVYQGRLESKHDAIVREGEYASNVVYQTILESEAEYLLFKDPDIGKDEL